jgi:hypothetical protein
MQNPLQHPPKHRVMAGTCAVAAAFCLAACNGGGDDQPQPDAEPAQTLPAPPGEQRYAVFKHDNGQPFSLYDAGRVFLLDGERVRLDLGGADFVDLGRDGATAGGLQLRSVLDGRILMLCAAPGSTPVVRFIAVTTAGAMALAPVYEASELAGRHFDAATDCIGTKAGHFGIGAGGELLPQDAALQRPQESAAELSAKLHGIWSAGSRYSAYRVRDGAGVVIVERSSADEVDRSNAQMRLWIAR